MKSSLQSLSYSSLHHLHVIGIGGGVTGSMAELLQAWGKRVSGSEERANEMTARLTRQGISCTIGARSLSLSPAVDGVVVSPRIPRTHPDVAAARRWGTPILTPAHMLGVMSATKRTVAIAGCHGKTTVGAYVGAVMERAQLDPSVLLRSPVEIWNSNVRCGKGEYFIIEADENERRFLTLTPSVGVIMNIEADHLEYFGDLDAIIRAYHQFARIVCAHGVLIAHRDDERVQRACQGIRGTIVWFGTEEGAEVRALNIRAGSDTASFLVHIKRGEDDVQFDLAVPGQHQIANALAVAAVCHVLKIPLHHARDSFASYHGGKRHMETIGQYGAQMVIDDAADHPSEITAVLHAVRARFPDHALWCVFQPYLARRTRYLMEEYATSFTDADAVIVLPVVPGVGEDARTHESAMLAKALGRYHPRVTPCTYARAVGLVRSRLPSRAVLLTLGADSVRELGKGFLQQKNA